MWIQTEDGFANTGRPDAFLLRDDEGFWLLYPGENHHPMTVGYKRPYENILPAANAILRGYWSV